ncbi:MAG TPA: hypothetical protein VIM57_09145 [Luteolibacter sp.]
MAAILMVLAFLVRFGGWIVIETSVHQGPGAPVYILLSLVSAILWVWGCCHLAARFGLSPAWGISGMLFLLGPLIIFWAANQKPKWDREAAKRAKQPKQEYRGDPTSLY